MLALKLIFSYPTMLLDTTSAARAGAASGPPPCAEQQVREGFPIGSSRESGYRFAGSLFCILPDLYSIFFRNSEPAGRAAPHARPTADAPSRSRQSGRDRRTARFRPFVIDEVPTVPVLFSAMKIKVDDNRTPARPERVDTPFPVRVSSSLEVEASATKSRRDILPFEAVPDTNACQWREGGSRVKNRWARKAAEKPVGIGRNSHRRPSRLCGNERRRSRGFPNETSQTSTRRSSLLPAIRGGTTSFWSSRFLFWSPRAASAHELANARSRERISAIPKSGRSRKHNEILKIQQVVNLPKFFRRGQKIACIEGSFRLY